MPTIDVPDQTYARLSFAARVAGITIAELLDRLTAPSDAAPSASGPQAVALQANAETKVYATYRGQRIDGFLDLETERLRVTAGPADLVGQSFRSPTQAAVAAVRMINPGRDHPETNGWRFWREAESGRIIDRLRGH